MSKILILKGLPASGKSTYAKELVNKGGWKRINKDDLRAMIDDSKWSKQNENFILEIRDSMITLALMRGFNVIVDDTNFAEKHIEDIKKIAELHNTSLLPKQSEITVEVKFFDTSVEECIRRDAQRLNSVGKEVIMRMYNQYLKPKPMVYIPPKDKPEAIIVDVDGTLAHGFFYEKGRRMPYDWKRVGEDEPDETVANLVRYYHRTGRRDILDETEGLKVIILSGRNSVCRPETEKWLKDNQIPYDDLFMRDENDSRKDTIVKKEMFEQHIKDSYRVLFVVDDRPSVCRMWRNEIGLKVLQVGDPDYEF